MVSDEAPRGLAPGETVAGRYRIEELLGEGGFGNVYRATQLNLDRPVALKVLHPELLLSDRSLDRFRREARLAQRLEHPNTVRLYDFGQTETGLPYIAWELLRGRPLDRVLLEDGPMPPARVARIVSQVLKSLMEAHEVGIVHRDVKPQNIFLSDFQGEPDFVKVLDFGVAKPQAVPGATPVTQEGEIIGTPSYMPPEQVRGEEVGPAADLYALGLVMAELLTGRMVFHEGSNFEICAEQLSEEPAPLDAEVLASPLGQVVARATAKPLGDRYGSAEAMLADLEAVAARSAADPAWLRAAEAPLDGGVGLAARPPEATGRGADAADPGTVGPGRAGTGSQRVHAGASDNRRPASSPPTRAPEGASALPRKRGLSAGLVALLVALGAVVLAGVVIVLSTAYVCRGCFGPGATEQAEGPPERWTAFPPPASAAELEASRRVVALSAGVGHACAVLDDGSVFCWGDNGLGQLGDGTVTLRPRPVRVVGVSGAVDVAVGSTHSCALSREGTLHCWGGGGDGQLGAGGTPTSQRTPAAVAGLGRVVDVAAGERHSCAALEDGTVACWGSNFHSQTGQPSGLSTSTPTRVEGLFEAVEMVAGRGHSCARLSDGRVLCWGANDQWQLGQGTVAASRAAPQPVPAVEGATALAAGSDHCCALRSDGQILCWGAGGDGQLGRRCDRSIPVPFSLPSRARAVAAGSAATCALLEDGAILCSGRNEQASLAVGAAETVASPTRLSAVTPYARLLPSGGRYFCAARDEPGARCWGILAPATRGAQPLVFAPTPTPVAFPSEDAPGGPAPASNPPQQPGG